MRTVWRDGQFVDRDQARVSVYSPAINYSHAVFDNCRAMVGGEGGRRRAWLVDLDDHLARFARSCEALLLELPHSLDELRSAVIEVIRRNAPDRDCAVRLFALNETGDFSADGAATVTIFMRSLDGYALERPYRLAIGSTVRTPLGSPPYWVKAMCHYAAGRLSTYEARQAGFDEALLLNDRGRLTETPRANIVLLKGDAAITPSVEEGLLPGLTRDIVQRLCEKSGRWRWEERPVHLQELGQMDGAVLCSSSLGVCPVSRIGPLSFADPAPGAALAGLYRQALPQGGAALSNHVDEIVLQ